MPRPNLIVAGVLLVLLVLLGACAPSNEPTALRAGRTIYGDICSACHGPRGEGKVGPSLAGVLETWPTCDAHVEWVSIGSDGWSVRYGDTYGATDKPIQGGMPAHSPGLTLEEIRTVAAFERVEYGGADPAEALADCKVG